MCWPHREDEIRFFCRCCKAQIKRNAILITASGEGVMDVGVDGELRGLERCKGAVFVIYLI